MFWLVERMLVIMSLLGAVFTAPLPPLAHQPLAASIGIIAPISCPAAGCAAGQRINVNVDFNLTRFDAARTPNVQVCLYAPINWSAGDFSMSPTGGLSTLPYTPSITYCESASAGYTLLGGGYTTHPSGSFGDTLTFGLRIGKTATTTGSVMVRVMERDAGDAWSRTGQAFSSVMVTPTGATVYVANSAIECGSYSPCYVNSGDDLPGGVGTGLKDAIDAVGAPPTINLLGSYTIKNNTVLVDSAVLIQGLSNAAITYTGAVCTQPMLKLTESAVLTHLNLNDGSCTGEHRDLVVIEAPGPVHILSSTLTDGKDAIIIGVGNTGSVELEFNHIQNNAGYAIRSLTGNTGVLSATANNLFGNRSGAQVECVSASLGTVNHNYWGAGVLPAAGSANCSSVADLRLGAPILQVSGTPGVSALRVTAQTTAHSYFAGEVTVQRSGGSDVDLYLINHGAGTAQNIPFTGGQVGNLTPCSNWYDIFVASDPATGTSLLLRFKYTLNSGCIAVIETAQFCNQTTNPAAYPLWFYDIPAGLWKPTGGPGGGPTTCSMDTDEILVTAQSDNADNINFSDLKFTPMVVGLPSQPGSVIITSFTPIFGNAQLFVRWTTSSEINISGYRVWRSESADSGFVEVSPVIPRTGVGTGGASYEYIDTGLTNNKTYYYRLKIINLDQTFAFSGTASGMPIPPTPTLTFTPSKTFTRTLTPVPSRTNTRIPTSLNTWTRTFTPTYTRTATTVFKSVTNTPTTQVTKTATSGTPTRVQYQILSTQIPPSPTPTLTPTATPRPFVFGSTSLTLLLAILAGLVAVIGLTWYLIRTLKDPGRV